MDEFFYDPKDKGMRNPKEGGMSDKLIGHIKGKKDLEGLLTLHETISKVRKKNEDNKDKI